MILGAGQRREEEELEHVDGELALDDLDVGADRVDRVAGKAEDVAGVRDFRYSVILFWRFFAPARLSGLMFSRPMKTRFTPAFAHLLDEVRDAVAERVDLDDEVE
jgi:hypothetical protein